MTNDLSTKDPSALLPGFVPERLNDRSQAIYCLGYVRYGIRPVGYGVTRDSRLVKYPGSDDTVSCTNHTVPTGRVAGLRVFQAINCLATIILSLRDNVPGPPDLHHRLPSFAKP
jgi:hypothetical protein